MKVRQQPGMGEAVARVQADDGGRFAAVPDHRDGEPEPPGLQAVQELRERRVADAAPRAPFTPTLYQ